MKEDIARYLSQQNGIWVFEVWDRIPEPGETDFRCVYTTHENAVQAVEQFLYGKPTLIDNWIVPFHRHPELSLEGVKNAITQAIHITQKDFDSIAERRKKSIENYYWVHGWRKHVWERTMQSQFLRIPHRYNTSIVLQLRRDMQETYIVRLRI